jgi:hypothetical protein
MLARSLCLCCGFLLALSTRVRSASLAFITCVCGASLAFSACVRDASLAFSACMGGASLALSACAGSMHTRSLLRAVIIKPCYEYLSQSPLLPTVTPCIIMSSDLPPRRSSRLSNKRTAVPDDGTESVVMTVIKRSGKRSDAGRRHTMTCTFVIDVRRILFDTVSLRHNIWTNSVQYMRGVVCSTVRR